MAKRNGFGLVTARYTIARMQRLAAGVVMLTAVLLGARAVAQQLPVIPVLVPVRPIAPPHKPLPPENETASITRFSFIAYGDTRSAVDGMALQPDHGAVIDAILAKVRSLA